MRISDWSSDVCSSDLHGCHRHPRGIGAADPEPETRRDDHDQREDDQDVFAHYASSSSACRAGGCTLNRATRRRSASITSSVQDRKSVGEGTGGSVRVDLGGRRSINKNTNTDNQRTNFAQQYNEK